MPLTRGRILGYDSARMTFGFTMLNGGHEVGFQISAAAIDKLVGGPRGCHVDRERQFSLLRETIERVASDEFSSDAFARAGVLRIFAKDIRKIRLGQIPRISRRGTAPEMYSTKPNP
jgi:hypothetical protein